MTGTRRSRLGSLAGFLWLFLIYTASAQTNVNLTFTNCLNPRIRNASTPLFTPLRVAANLNATSKSLRISVYGNVTGSISDTNDDNTLASALTNTIEVAGFIQKRVEERLCNISYYEQPTYGLVGPRIKKCPVGPGAALLEFETLLNFGYTFSSITNTIRVNDATRLNYETGCLQVTVTPPLPEYLQSVLTYVPLAILILVGIKVVSVAVLNPWSGTLDPYRSFSNFGMDVNALRMATPGFSDCLAYVQFAAYTSMMRLNYPGFFQLVTSRFAWALLLFESSPITKALNFFPQRNSDIASYINHVGPSRQDAWRSFMVWFLIVQACVVGLVCILVGLWWLLTPSSTDLTMKNIPFLCGCLLRVYYWLLLPLSLFTCYQLITAQQSNAGLVASAALVFMVLVILFPTILLIWLPRHAPRQDLYEDVAVLNFWGPLYNTFSEHAVHFWRPQLLLSIARGMVIGLLINYGVAQLVLLALMEVLTLGLIFWQRPWPAKTNTTLVQLIIIGFRIVILFLMVPFVPSLETVPGQREWIGYIILIFHAIVMVFIILGNCLLTLLELAIRLLVIVPQEEGAKVIFGARQLRSRRRPKNVTTALAPASTKDGFTPQSSANLLEAREDSPFFRRPRHGSRVESGFGSRLGVNSQDARSISVSSGLTGYTSPLDRPHTSLTTRVSSYQRPLAGDSLTSPTSRPLMQSRPTSSTTHMVEPIADKEEAHELTLAPTEDAERRGVDYAVREADIYHPQNSGELLGPSKKLGTGPADPAGVHFRRFNWTPWRRARNPEKGKFVVVRSAPAGPFGTSTAAGRVQRRSSSMTSNGMPLQVMSTQTSGFSDGPLSPQEDIQEDEDEDRFALACNNNASARPSRPRITIGSDESDNDQVTSVDSANALLGRSPNDQPSRWPSTPQATFPSVAISRSASQSDETDSSADAVTQAVDSQRGTAGLQLRPNIGSRGQSYQSEASHISGPGSAVQNGTRPAANISQGRSAQLVNFDLDA